METIGLCAGSWHKRSADLAPGFLWTELKTCQEQGLNSLQPSAVVKDKLKVAEGEQKDRKKHLA